MSSEKENIDLKSKEKKHGQIEFVRTNCPVVCNALIIGRLWASGQAIRTNSICPCVFFLLSTDSSAGYQPMLASKRVEYVGKAVKVQM